MPDDDFEVLELIAPGAGAGRLTNQQILLGQKHDPLEIIKIYSDDEWEQFIREWLEGLRGKYKDVRRVGGARDKGRDVIGYVQAMNECGLWDNYQCKHYDHALYPSDLWKELAKLCLYTFEKKYTVPRAYYFVAPRGVGPEALLLLENPVNLRAGLMARWDAGDLLKIGKTEIVLEGDLRTYVEAFDFSIVKDLPPSKIVEDTGRPGITPRGLVGGWCDFHQIRPMSPNRSLPPKRDSSSNSLKPTATPSRRKWARPKI